MREENIRQFAPRFGIPTLPPKTGNGWIELPCVLAPWTHDKGHDSKPSAAIKINEAGKSWYTCQQCHHSVSFANLAFKLYGFTQEIDYQKLGFEIEQHEMDEQAHSLPDWEEGDAPKEERKHVVLPRSALNRFTLAYQSPICRDYLAGRGLPAYTAIRLGLRYDYREDRILFPVFDRLQELRGFVGRAMHPDTTIKVKDYGGLQKEELMLGEHWVFANKHKLKYVVVVEGPFDYAKVRMAGHPVLALFGSKLTKYKFDKLVALNLPIIWMVDNDAAGYACIYGPINKSTDEREPHKGALAQLDNYVPQLVVEYPRRSKSKKEWNDPGQLNKQIIDKMIKNAEMYLSSAA